MAVQSSLYLLDRAGHIECSGSYRSTEREVSGCVAPRRSQSISLLDDLPESRLRVDSNDVARRAALERRKIREMIDFCYTEYCYRAHILDYFGDRHHARQCG